jgi:PAS domain-containing protein
MSSPAFSGGCVGEKTRKDRSEFHIRALMANASEGFVVVDRDGRVRVLNETAAELLDADRAKVVGAKIDRLIRQCQQDRLGLESPRISQRLRRLGQQPQRAPPFSRFRRMRLVGEVGADAGREGKQQKSHRTHKGKEGRSHQDFANSRKLP